MLFCGFVAHKSQWVKRGVSLPWSHNIKHWLTNLHHSSSAWLLLKISLLVTVAWRLIVRAMLLISGQDYIRVLIGVSLKGTWWHFTRICLWSHGNEPQSQWGKAKTIGCEHMEYSVAFPPRSSLPASMLVRIHILFQNIGQLQTHGKGISIWIICLKICVLSIWLPVCVHEKGCVWTANISCGFQWSNLAETAFVNGFKSSKKTR